MKSTTATQTFFPFVNPLEWVREMQRSRENKKRTRGKQARLLSTFRDSLKEALASQLDQLSLDLVVRIEAVTRVISAESETASPSEKGVETLVELIGWSDHDLIQLHDFLIVKALEDLKHARSRETRFEILCWLAPAAQADAPFSFESCCGITGLSPDPIRHHVKKMYIDEIREFIEADGPVKKSSLKPALAVA